MNAKKLFQNTVYVLTKNMKLDGTKVRLSLLNIFQCTVYIFTVHLHLLNH